MAGRAGSITVDLLLKTANFETDTKRAAANLKRMQKEAEAVGRAIGIAFAAAATASTIYFKSQIDQLDALNDLSDATGSTVENLSALEDVARRNGQTLDDVSGILVKFNNALKESDGKNGVSQALSAIGLSYKELQALDPAEALRQTAVALSKFADDGNKARIVQELFGKSVKEAGPFLKDLAEQGRLNATVTTDQAKAAEEFNKNLFSMQKNVADAARAILADLVPAINAVFRDVRGGSFFDNVFGALGLGGSTAAEALVNQSTKINDAIAETQKSIAKLQEQAGGSGSIYAEKGIADLEKRLVGLRAEAAATEKQMTLLASLNKGSGPAIADPAKPALPPLPKPVKTSKEVKPTDFSAHVKAYEENLKGLSDALIDAVQAQESFIRQQEEAVKSAQAEANAAKDSLRYFGLSRHEVETLEIAKVEAAAASLEHSAVLREERDELDPIAKLYRDQASALREAATARADLSAKEQQLQNDPFTGASKAVKDYLDNIKKAGDATYDVVSEAAHGLEDVLTSKDPVKAAKRLVNDLILEFYRLLVIRPLMQSILGSGGSGLSSILGMFSGGGGFGTGSSFGNQDYGAFLAEGTNRVPYDGFKAILHKDEAVVPARFNPAAGGSNVKFEVHDYTGAAKREEVVERNGQKIHKLIIGTVIRDSRRGGPTRQATREAVGPRPRRG